MKRKIVSPIQEGVEGYQVNRKPASIWGEPVVGLPMRLTHVLSNYELT